MTDQVTKPGVLQALDAIYIHVASTAESESDLDVADQVEGVTSQVEPLLDVLRDITALAGEPIPLDLQRRAQAAYANATRTLTPKEVADLQAKRTFADINHRARSARGAA